MKKGLMLVFLLSTASSFSVEPQEKSEWEQKFEQDMENLSYVDMSLDDPIDTESLFEQLRHFIKISKDNPKATFAGVVLTGMTAEAMIRKFIPAQCPRIRHTARFVGVSLACAVGMLLESISQYE